MGILSSVDTSQHTTPLSLLQLQNNQLTTTAKDVDKYSKLETPNVAALDSETPKVDLNNYYSNVQPTRLNSETGDYLAQAGENFENAVMDALQNGFDPQTAVNLQKAKTAYIATMKVVEASNFELKI